MAARLIHCAGVIALLLLVNVAAAQTLRFEDRQKASSAVIEAAQAGRSQDLFVVLDAKDIEEREFAKRKSRRLQMNDEALNRETEAEFDALKKAVFPEGRLGEATIIQDRKPVPILYVRVPNWSALARVLSHPRVLSVHPNDKVLPATSQSLPLIGQPTALAAGKSGAGYRVAIIDSGIRYREPMFSASGKGCRFNVPVSSQCGGYPEGDYIGSSGCAISNAIDATMSPAKENLCLWERHADHGTIIAGTVARVAPKAKIDVLQAYGPDETAYRSYIFNAMDWVLSHSTGTAGRIVAVNLSYGGTSFVAGECPSSEYAAYFSRLRSNGIIPVVSTGNSGAKNGLPEPSCAPGALRVGSVWDANFSYDMNFTFDIGGGQCTDKTPRQDQVACYSNSSSVIHLLAPGGVITPEGLGGIGGIGTSFAAPHVAGAIAVLKQAFPSDSADGTIARMTSSGKSVVDALNLRTTPRLSLSNALATVTLDATASSVEMQASVSVLNMLLIH